MFLFRINAIKLPIEQNEYHFSLPTLCFNSKNICQIAKEMNILLNRIMNIVNVLNIDSRQRQFFLFFDCRGDDEKDTH